MTNDHGSCKSCGYSFNGRYVWDHLFEETGSEEQATNYAEMYGCSKGNGRFGKQVGIYDIGRDATVAWLCPNCGYRW